MCISLALDYKCIKFWYGAITYFASTLLGCSLVSELRSAEAMDVFHEGWFTDKHEVLWPGQALSLEVEELLHHEKSKYMDITIFQR